MFCCADIFERSLRPKVNEQKNIKHENVYIVFTGGEKVRQCIIKIFAVFGEIPPLSVQNK